MILSYFSLKKIYFFRDTLINCISLVLKKLKEEPSTDFNHVLLKFNMSIQNEFFFEIFQSVIKTSTKQWGIWRQF